MPYMLAPGARLEVGPGGKMYETMGAFGTVTRSDGATASMSSVMAAQIKASNSTQPAAAYAASSASGPGIPPILLIAGAAAAGLGLLYFLKRKKRKNPSRGRRRNPGDSNRPGEFYPPSRVGRPSLIKKRRFPSMGKRR